MQTQKDRIHVNGNVYPQKLRFFTQDELDESENVEILRRLLLRMYCAIPFLLPMQRQFMILTGIYCEKLRMAYAGN